MMNEQTAGKKRAASLRPGLLPLSLILLLIVGCRGSGDSSSGGLSQGQEGGDPGPLESLVIDSEAITVPFGRSVPVTVTGFYADGSASDLSADVTWHVSAPAVVEVISGSPCLVVGIEVGTGVVQASLGDVFSPTVQVEVTEAALDSLTLQAPSQVRVGDTVGVTVTGHYDDGAAVDLSAEVTWHVGNESVLTILPGSPAAMIGLAVGTSEVQASLDDVFTLPMTIEVTAAQLQSLTIEAPTLVTVGEAVGVTAIGVYSDASTEDLSAEVEWLVENPDVVEMQPGTPAVLLGLAVGTSDIRARLGDVDSPSLTIEVSAATLESLSLQAPEELVVGDAAEVRVIGTLSDGSELDLSSEVEFEISNPEVISVTSGSPPVLNALQPGSSDLSALYLDVPSNALVITVDPGSVEDGWVDSVSQHGITWTFDRPYPVGNFINGDYWVVGPVTIESIDPPSALVNGRIANGSMINPLPGIAHGWDSTLYGTLAGDHYQPDLNAAFAVSPVNPLVVAPGSSLVSSISHPEAGKLPGLKTAAVLTVVSAAPPSESFRPPYAGASKPIYGWSDVRTDRLGQYPEIGDTPDFGAMADEFARVWLEHSNVWLSRYQHPSDNMPWYGRDMSWRLGKAALMLSLDRPLVEKKLLLVRMLQIGIDLDGLRGVGLTWPARAGDMIGRKFPILFKRHLFGENAHLGDDPTQFSEDDQTFYVLETSPGVINYGYPNTPGYLPYTSAQVGMPEWAVRYWSEDPIGSGAPGHTWYLDGPRWPNSQGHRWCCTARALTGHYLAAHMLGLVDEWNWPAGFDYQDRYLQIAKDSHRTIDDWTLFMWDAYRPTFGGYAPVPPEWIPPDAPGAPGPALESISLQAPTSLEVGESAEVTVTGTFSDGSQTDLSLEATFIVSDSSVISVASGSTAILSALAAGTSDLSATHEGLVSNTVAVHVTEAPQEPGWASSISQYGITWTFDGNYQVGTFINGDYWVVGPVKIESIDPPSTQVNGRIKNGSMINPRAGLAHGWDNELYGPHKSDHYKSYLNVAFGVSPSNRLTVGPGESLISAISEDAAGAKPGLKSAAVLTVLASPPPAGSFRPPYAGTDKSLYNWSQVRTERLRRVAEIGNTPDYDVMAAEFQRVWLEHSNIWMSSYQHPSGNMPWYGRDMAWRLGKAALMLNLDRPLAEKELLLIRFLQIGIDFDGLRGIGITWPALGGYMNGRKFPIMFKRYLFGENPNLGSNPEQFSEDDQTYYVLETSPGVINYGYPNTPGYPPYTSAQVGMPEWGHRYWSEDPLGEGSSGHTWFLDGPRWPNGQGHRWCCTNRALTGHYLAAYIMGLDDEWNHPAGFDYQDRYMQIAKDSHRTIDNWTTYMWDAYRPSFGGYTPIPDAWIPADAP